MRKLRLTILLAFVAMLDLGAGTLPGVPEGLEEFEEAAHGRRRLVRLAQQPAPPSTDREPAAASAHRPRPASYQPRARAVAEPPRKVPVLASDSASPTDDH
jgi:hypothetical protein